MERQRFFAKIKRFLCPLKNVSSVPSKSQKNCAYLNLSINFFGGVYINFCGVIIPTSYNKAIPAELKWEFHPKR